MTDEEIRALRAMCQTLGTPDYARTAAEALADEALRRGEEIVRCRDQALEEAACVADQHWPESGHAHDAGTLSCQATISVLIRRLRNGTPRAFVDEQKLAKLSERIAKPEAALHEMYTLVDRQAEDEGLWFITKTASEAYLQQELRRLRKVIEQARAALEGKPC